MLKKLRHFYKRLIGTHTRYFFVGFVAVDEEGYFHFDNVSVSTMGFVNQENVHKIIRGNYNRPLAFINITSIYEYKKAQDAMDFVVCAHPCAAAPAPDAVPEAEYHMGLKELEEMRDEMIDKRNFNEVNRIQQVINKKFKNVA